MQEVAGAAGLRDGDAGAAVLASRPGSDRGVRGLALGGRGRASDGRRAGWRGRGAGSGPDPPCG